MVSVNIALELRILLLLILSDAYLMPLVRLCGCKDITKSALNEKLKREILIQYVTAYSFHTQNKRATLKLNKRKKS